MTYAELPSLGKKVGIKAIMRMKEDEAGAGTAKSKLYSSRDGSGAIVPTEIGVNCNEQHDAHVPAGGVTDNGPKAMKAGKIPPYEGLLNKSKAKGYIPNFKKIHEAQFIKMESIDSLVQRKQKCVEDLKTLREKTPLNPVKVKNQKPPAGPASLFSPALSKPADDKRRHITPATKPVLKKPAQKEDARFRPSVLSTPRRT